MPLEDIVATIVASVIVLAFVGCMIYICIKMANHVKVNYILQNKKLNLEIADLERKAEYYEGKRKDN